MKAEVASSVAHVSLKNHTFVKGWLDTFLNLRTASTAVRAKHIMIDSIKMKRDWVRIALSKSKISLMTYIFKEDNKKQKKSTYKYMIFFYL